MRAFGITVIAITSLTAGITLLSGEPLATSISIAYAVTTATLTMELPTQTTQ